MPPVPAPTSPQWPPRSPHEALVSTPGGRKRYRRMLDQTSPTPSPQRRARNLPTVNLLQEMGQGNEDEDEDEDEEMLRLKLQEIQARLRLKKLQKSKRASEDGVDSLGATTSGLAISSEAANQPKQSVPPPVTSPRRSTMSQADVEVPASPVRKAKPPQVPTSPSRVLLGIDKGLTARDVSLKRAPSYRDSQVSRDSAPSGGYLRRSRTATSVPLSFDASRPLSFNERLASARNEETTRLERQERAQKMRSTAFGISQDEMDQFKETAVEIPDVPLQPPVFSREEVLQAKPMPTRLQRSNTLPSVRPSSQTSSSVSGSTAPSTTGSNKQMPPAEISEEQASSFEPYSSFHLSKRILPHNVLARHVSGKKVFSIKDLLKDVKSPDFALPDIEQDIVVFAILAKKSDPRSHKPSKHGGEDRGKYMVMNLVDLQYELDLFLFNSGFTRFWKLTEGTVIAILNPNIMPPPPGRQDTGKFSLVINSDADSIVEVGKARDLGFCQSMKKDGDLCGSWVNKKRTSFCEFHSNQAISKKRATRMEVNSSSFGTAGERKHNSRELHNWGKKQEDAKKEQNRSYDWETKTHWFVSRSMSAADLIDGKDRTPADRKDRAEFMKRDLEAKEKEREMMKKLGKIGNAAGREYMQRAGSRGANGLGSGLSQSQPPSSRASIDDAYRPDAKSLGLTKGSNIHLSPVKRKRPESSQAGSLSNGRVALGWGSNLKDKLSRMKEGEKLRKEEQPPVRKKTRFVTDKGIREAGRESLGTDLAERQVMLEDDDDDELVIV